jgi:hypothetical protein
MRKPKKTSERKHTGLKISPARYVQYCFRVTTDVGIVFDRIRQARGGAGIIETLTSLIMEEYERLKS